MSEIKPKPKWLAAGHELARTIAEKYDVQLPYPASREIFESMVKYICQECVLKTEVE